MTDKEQTTDPAPDLELTLEELGWDEIRAMKPSQLAAHLTQLGRSAQGSPRVLRDRLASFIGAEPPDPEPLTVWEAVREVKASIGSIDKDRTMSQGGSYRYRGIDAILDAAHAGLVQTGLLIVPERVVPTYEARTTSGGKPSQWVSLHVCWRIYGPAGDSISAATVGEAADVSDKATNKAHTAAWKVLLSELFAIPYSADEQDAERQEAGEVGAAPALSPAEVQGLAARADQLQESLDNLPADLYEKAVQRMTQRAVQSGAAITCYDDVCALGTGESLSQWLTAWEKLLKAAWTKAEAEETPDPAPELVEE